MTNVWIVYENGEREELGDVEDGVNFHLVVEAYLRRTVTQFTGQKVTGWTIETTKL